jgi:hypothetical protein
MAPFDFPNSPANGDVYRPTGGPAYQWDGEKWKGGQPSGPQKELVIDLTGKTTIEVVVPTWAKSCIIDGVLWPANTSSFTLVQLSTDGTNFHAGTNYALVGGIVHNVQGGYTTQALVSGPGIYLDYPNSNLLIAHTFACHLNLEAAISGQLISARSEAQSYGANGGMQIIWEGYLNVGVAPARVQKLKFTSQSGVYPIGSYLHITWIGDAAQVPISNAIPDAPMDGKPWVRRNGLWVKQTGVVQQKVFYDSSDFSRAVVSEAAMSALQTFTPLYPDSKVYWEWSSYATLTTTAAIDDIRGRLYGKWYNGTSYQAVLLGTLVNGHVNFGGTALSSVFYGYWGGGPVDVSAYVATTGSDPLYLNKITIKLHGNPDYASVTLDTYDCTMKFTEILE